MWVGINWHNINITVLTGQLISNPLRGSLCNEVCRVTMVIFSDLTVQGHNMGKLNKTTLAYWC